MKKLYTFLILFISAVSAIVAQDKVLTDQQNHLFGLFFSEALKCRLHGDYQKSVEMYINCLKLNEKSSSVAYELAKILKNSNDFENANKFIDMAMLNDDTNNKFYIELAIDIKLALQKYDETLPLLDKLISSNTQDIQSYLLASKVCSELKNYDKALYYLDKIEDQDNIEEYLLPTRYDILMMKGDKKKAYKLINAKYKEHPDNAKYNFYMADYYLRINKTNNGIVSLKAATECNDGDIYNFDMASLMLQMKKYNAFKIYSLKGFTSPNVAFSVKISKLLNSLTKQDVLPSDFDIKGYFTHVLDTIVDMYPDEEQIYSIYCEFCNQFNEPEKALKLYRQLHSYGGMSVESWRDFLLRLSTAGQYDDVLSLSKEALVSYPDEPLILLLYGECLVVKKQYSEAISPLRHSYSVLSSLNNSQLNNIKVAVMNDLATSYYYTDSASMAFQYFDELLKVDPYNVGALNNYSYYLSLENKDLDKAEQMSRKTIDIDPGNPTYLDTYAWVLFKKKSYGEAQFIIERAIDKVKPEHDNSEIYDHYGDILFKLGNYEKAIEMWQKSYDLMPSELIKKKIDAKNIVE